MEALNRFNSMLAECPLFVVLRHISLAEVPAVCDILTNAGIRLLEITMNTPNALECIRTAIAHCAGKSVMIGAGTVLTPEEVDAVADAGGSFIVSPNTDATVIRATKARGLVSIPGFFTCSEAFVAQQAGADVLKLFPADLGPGYIKSLKAVVSLPIMAVGGVSAETIPEFMKVCAGVGIGTSLYKAGKSLEAIEADTKKIVEILRSCRQ